MSEEIFRKVVFLPEFQKAKNILWFAGYGSEPDTLSFLPELLAIGKRVYCPLVEGDVMEFYQVSDESDFTEGYKGIPEPKADNKHQYVPCKEDFMIIPGTVFDREGNRIGYGKGFYDKYLSDVFTGQTAAIAFSFQVIENGNIPAEETDVKMSYIVTEKEIIRI
jgi:5-formyltetrahydrofolate cyclo-ligase